jgi:MFS family permease
MSSDKHPATTSTIISDPLAESDPVGQRLRQQRLLFTGIACVSYSGFALTANGWGPLLAPLATTFSFSLEQIGLLFVIWLIGYLPGTLLGGSLLDLLGPRLVFLAAFLCLVGGMGGIVLAATIHLSWLFGLAVGAGIAGAGGGTIDAAANGLMSSLYPQKRGTALNLFTALYPLSALVISFVDGGFLLLFRNDPRPSLLFALGLCLLALALAFWLPAPLHHKRSAIQRLDRAWWEPLLAQGKSVVSLLLPVVIAIVLTTGFTATIRTWTPAYLHLTYGQAPAVAALLSGLMNGLVLVFRLGVSLLVDRIGTRSTILLGLCVTIIGLLGTVSSRANAVMGTVALTITAIGLTPLVATFMALGNERAAGQFSGSVTGLVLCVAGISNVLWSWLFGVVLTRAGSSWAMLGCLLPLLCGALLVWRLRNEHEGPLPSS